MGTNENNGIANALSPAVCTCTMLVSIGPYISEYYFCIILLFFIFVILTLEFTSSRRKSYNRLTYQNDIAALSSSYMSNGKEKSTRSKRVTDLRERFAKTRSKTIFDLVNEVNNSNKLNGSKLNDQNKKLNGPTVSEKAFPPKKPNPGLNENSVTKPGMVTSTPVPSKNKAKKHSDSILSKPKKKTFSLFKSKLGKSYHISMIDQKQVRFCP